MASRFYGVNKGQNTAVDVVEGSSTGSKAVELQVDLSKTTDRQEVLQCLEAIKNYLISRETSPIA